MRLQFLEWEIPQNGPSTQTCSAGQTVDARFPFRFSANRVMRGLALFGVIVAFFTFCPPLVGAPVTIDFTGVVTMVNQPGLTLPPSIAVGATASGSYTYDVSTATSDAPGHYHFDGPPAAMSFTVAGETFETNSMIRFSIYINNNVSHHDRFFASQGENPPLRPITSVPGVDV